MIHTWYIIMTNTYDTYLVHNDGIIPVCDCYRTIWCARLAKPVHHQQPYKPTVYTSYSRSRRNVLPTHVRTGRTASTKSTAVPTRRAKHSLLINNTVPGTRLLYGMAASGRHRKKKEEKMKTRYYYRTKKIFVVTPCF